MSEVDSISFTLVFLIEGNVLGATDTLLSQLGNTTQIYLGYSSVKYSQYLIKTNMRNFQLIKNVKNILGAS